MDSELALSESENILREIVNTAKEEGLFDNLNILKPFSILMVDDEMETLAELLMIDDDQLLLDDDFIKQMDHELDTFLKDLMSDV